MIISDESILVIVHPGSACGSANFNIGLTNARSARDDLTCELNEWTGAVVVIDGDFSDELSGYPRYDQAIKNSLSRAKDAGLMSLRLQGDDPDQIKRIEEVMQTMGGETCSRSLFTVTGAWYDNEDGGGCVGSVVDKIRSLGARSCVSSSAVRYDVDEASCGADEMDEGTDSEDDPTPSKPLRP